jgi:hypothetical protein
VVWKIKVPPRIHIFLWLVANNKTLPRDNLVKRRPVEDGSCLFCAEQESVAHLFFDRCIAMAFWCWIIEITGVELGSDFESIDRFWILGNKYKMLNVLSSPVLWTLRKTRNILCFKDYQWRDLRELVGQCARMLRDWRMLQKPEDAAMLDSWIQALEKRRALSMALPWEDQVAALAPNTRSVHQGVDLVLAGVPGVCDVPLDVWPGGGGSN